ncbi:MAG: hypothetical protein RBR02_07885, partial [Desulfuromonadaceae bacterium]|nr:hypothetical protein [Desulfuromonadaceae bacterium]
MIDYLLAKAREDERLTQKEIQHLLSYEPYSDAACRMIGVASELSRKLQDNEAEIHGQLALNLSPCPEECKFCSFAASNGVFGKSSELSIEEAVAMAKSFEEDGCHAILAMTTANFPYAKVAPY